MLEHQRWVVITRKGDRLAELTCNIGVFASLSRFMDWRDSQSRRHLRSIERRRLLQALNDLCRFQGGLEGYAKFVTELLRELLDSDLADYGEVNPSAKMIGGLYWTPGTSYQERVVAHAAHMSIHPVFWLDQGFYGEKVLGNRDIFTDREFQATPIYRDSFRPDGMKHFLNTCLPQGNWMISHGVYRSGRGGFGVREQALFAAIKPHLRQAYSAARGRTLLAMSLRERVNWRYPDLTIRQQEVMVGISKGLSNQEIAEKLRLDINTIKTYQKALFEKLNLKNRTQLAMAVCELDDKIVLTRKRLSLRTH